MIDRIIDIANPTRLSIRDRSLSSSGHNKNSFPFPSPPRQQKLLTGWRQIVRAKIGGPWRLLKEIYGSDARLTAMSARVRSDDARNLEAQAGRRYWPLVFGKLQVLPWIGGTDQNHHLDYGYVVLHAAVARALCAARLRPPSAYRTRIAMMLFAFPQM
jgi:hypothetical protein